MNLTLHVWRQEGPDKPGRMVEYKAEGVSPDSSFLEMLDLVNEHLIQRGEEPIAFDHDCREGICGMCSLVINGVAHGPKEERVVDGVEQPPINTTTCQLHMRHFKDGDVIYVEPWRARAFPIVKDLVVDRTAFDRVIQAGGYVSVNTGSAPEANSNLIAKVDADAAFASATCIGCGACVAACKNASAMLFVAAKVSQLSLLPQGQVERKARVQAMVEQMDAEGFGNCTNYGECSAVCPKNIPLENIARMNREYLKATLLN
jgi:succinate dehydrogenase / fumarate reductase iron-sulfur subunit